MIATATPAIHDLHDAARRYLHQHRRERTAAEALAGLATSRLCAHALRTVDRRYRRKHENAYAAYRAATERLVELMREAGLQALRYDGTLLVDVSVDRLDDDALVGDDDSPMILTVPAAAIG